MSYRQNQYRGLGVRLLTVLACLLLPGGLALPQRAHAEEKGNAAGQRGPASSLAPSLAPPARRILFLGNSMTLHGPNPAIGWTGNWGMAASAPEKDFVHLIIRALAEKSGAAPQAMIRNIAGFERQYASYNVDKELKDALDFKADTVIVAIGENVPKLDSDQAKARFKASLLKLLQMLKTNNNPAIFVRSCFWPNPVVDPILKEVAQSAGSTFIDISALGKDEANYARSERPFKHAGVARHPGNRGMQAMAKAILTAMEKQQEEAAGNLQKGNN